LRTGAAAYTDLLGIEFPFLDNVPGKIRIGKGHTTDTNQCNLAFCLGDSSGRPGKLTVRRYERFAGGGAGLLWFEATAVVPEGRANPRQLWLHKGTKDSFAALVKRIRQSATDSCGTEHRPVLIAQLTHSGRYSKPAGKPEPIIPQHDPYRDAMTPQPQPDKNALPKIPADPPLPMNTLTNYKTPT